VSDTTVVMGPQAIELPTTGDPSQWSEDQKALLDAAGLVIRKKGKEPVPAPRSTVVAFLAHCRRTGLDPIARQIYAIERGGKWGIQVSIDGFRLVAERSRHYAGQRPIQWTADGVTWVDVWLSDEPPAAARATVLRHDFEEPMVAVARYSSYVVMVDKWEGPEGARKKVGVEPGPMWARMPEVMIAKVAEALALRKAFPMELSGLYTEEEMDQALEPVSSAPRASRSASPTLQPGTRSAQRDPIPGAKYAEDVSVASDGPVGAEAAESADEVGLFPCTVCGDSAVEDEAGICEACEARIEADSAAGGEES